MPICPGQVEVICPSTMNNTPHYHYYNNNTNNTNNYNNSSNTSSNNNPQDDNIFVDARAGFAYIACTSLHGNVYV